MNTTSCVLSVGLATPPSCQLQTYRTYSESDNAALCLAST